MRTQNSIWYVEVPAKVVQVATSPAEDLQTWEAEASSSQPQPSLPYPEQPSTPQPETSSKGKEPAVEPHHSYQ
ncbi:hypothetical protein O0I10_000809 [Lichtheimia ornata]|uniref:Uncharacterized protein n=1 Tax=Lichtheimia ornata TaxID=688661 RepID=A0AAD7Y4D0_9FUNG|nr:uncharacterized protein O0I10_000809 [Lichtheimia ornata]KAJ8663566.1 hypothetical protein O0I10_000809 [Lichtheimia ornata]